MKTIKLIQRSNRMYRYWSIFDLECTVFCGIGTDKESRLRYRIYDVHAFRIWRLSLISDLDWLLHRRTAKCFRVLDHLNLPVLMKHLQTLKNVNVNYLRPVFPVQITANNGVAPLQWQLALECLHRHYRSDICRLISSFRTFFSSAALLNSSLALHLVHLSICYILGNCRKMANVGAFG